MNNWLLTGAERKKIWESYKEHWAKQDPKYVPNVSDYEYIQDYLLPAQARHILERLNEECIEPEHYKNVATPIGWRKRHRCFQCMAEFEKELIGEK